MRLGFRFRLVPFIATVVLVALGISLAQWQTRRAEQKLALEATLRARQEAPAIRLAARPSLPIAQLEYRRVLLKGSFLPDWPIFVDNRPHQGIAGFYLLMPFKIASSNLYVLVARGWFPRNVQDRTRMPAIATPSGTLEIEGIVRSDIGHVMQLGTLDPPRPHAIVQNLDSAAFARASGLNAMPFIVEQVSALPDGLLRDWPALAVDVERHRGYAFQWYALAAMALIFFIATGFRRGAR
ncbi:MAG TPA: SURF1 family protein [Oxalicibacterium sp.]|nr:SURF1 family protein [Oxalicibacterium sp.]